MRAYWPNDYRREPMEQETDARVQRLVTPRECAIFERNAQERQRDDLALQARHRWVELTAASQIEAEEGNDPLRGELWKALSALEYVLGRNATGARQVIRRRGLVRAADQFVSKGDLSVGLAHLDDAGLLDYAWEHVVLRHSDAFSEAARQAARQRLDEHEVERAADA
jgi:hypothetical protein